MKAAAVAREKKKYPQPEPDPEILGNLAIASGWAAFPHQLFAHIGRLTNKGSVQPILLFYAWGATHDKARPRKFPFTYPELAAVCRCSVRDVQYQVEELTRLEKCDDGVKRSVLVKKNVGRTGAKFHLEIPLDEWALVPDYVSRKPMQVAETSVPDTEAAQDQEQEKRGPGFQKLPRARVKAGIPSKEYPITVGTSATKYLFDNADVEMRPVIEEGVFFFKGHVTRTLEEAKEPPPAPRKVIVRRAQPRSRYGSGKSVKRRNKGKERTQVIDSKIAVMKPVSSNGNGKSPGEGLRIQDFLRRYANLTPPAADAGKQLLGKCRRKLPGCSEDEVLVLAGKLVRTPGFKKATDRVAWLIAVIPKLIGEAETVGDALEEESMRELLAMWAMDEEDKRERNGR